MGKFNLDDHYIYYCGQEPLRRNRVALTINQSVKNTVLGCNLKNDRIISVGFQGKPFKHQAIQHHDNSSLCPNHWCQRSRSWLVLWRPTRPSRTNSKKKKKKSFLIIWDWNEKLGSQDAQNNGSLAFEYKMKQGKGWQSFVNRKHWSYQTPFSGNTRDNSAHTFEWFALETN